MTRGKAVLSVLGLLLAGVGLAAWLGRAELRAQADATLDTALQRATGLPGARARLRDLGWDHAEVTDLRSGPGGPSLDRLHVTFDPWALLLDRRITAATVDGLRLPVSVDASGDVSLGPLDALLATPGGEETAWSVDRLTLGDIRVSIDSPFGQADLDLTGRARHGPGGYGGTATVSGRVRPAGRASFSVEGTLEAGDPRHIRLSLVAEAPPLPRIDARRLTLAADIDGERLRGDLDLEAAEGRAGLTLAATRPEDWTPEALAAEGTLTLDFVTPIRAAGTLAWSLAEGTLALRPAKEIRLDLPDAAVRLPPAERPVAALALTGGPVELSLPRAELTAAGQTLTVLDTEGRLDPAARRLSLRRATLRHAAATPLRLSGEARQDGDALVFDARLGDPGGRLVIEATGRHDLDSGEGRAETTLHPLTFMPQVWQPRDLIPAAGDHVSDVAGRVRGGGPVRWSAAGLESAIDLRLEDLSLTAAGVRLQGVGGRIRLSRPWPPATPEGQRLIVKAIPGQVPLTDLEVSFRLDGSDQLAVEGLWGHLAGGVVSTGPAVLPPGPEPRTVTLGARDLDLKRLIELVQVDHLSGSGAVSGHVPVTLGGDSWSIDGALLQATGRGRVRYRPEQTPTALKAGGQGASLMMQALENLHYDDLRLTAERTAEGDWDARLHIAGRNPDVMKGYPFAFNLNLSGMLDVIVRRALQSYQLPADIGRMLPRHRQDPAEPDKERKAK